MKKIFHFLLAISLCTGAWGQAQIQTKKFKLIDFREKPLEVILTGNDFLDIALKEAIKSNWTLSAYDFCNYDQFEANKKSEDYYFLITTDTRFLGEPSAGIKMLTIYKGAAGAGTDIDGMTEITSIPLCPSSGITGDGMLFIPALITNLQTQVCDVMEKGAFGGSFKPVISKTFAKWNESIFIKADDLAFGMNDTFKATCENNGIFITDSERIAKAVESGEENTLVGYVISPTAQKKGNSYFVMLFNASTGELYYSKKRKIHSEGTGGFQQMDFNLFLEHKRK